MNANDNEIVNQFLLRYAREFDFYDRAASLCARHCEEVLGQAAVRAMVTFRAKRPDRLRPKVEKRAEKKRSESTPYNSPDDIYNDIVDLAGVRIALYFPGDMSKVDEIICREFDVDPPKKQFPERVGVPDPNKKFSGYAATHYRIRLKRGNLSRGSERFSECRIEIQVASVLMHAWAEVEHDLAYKPYSGTLSSTERAILDEINGLVLTGELALNRLQEAVDARIAKQSQPFANQYELAIHVYEIYKEALKDQEIPDSALPTPEPAMGRADILLAHLRKTARDRPELLKQSLRAWTPDPRDKQTIVEQILKYLILDVPIEPGVEFVE